MSRELDLRDFSTERVTSERQNELKALAAAASARLPGAHQVTVTRFDTTTGNPAVVTSEFAPPEKGNYIQRALDYVQNISRVLGLTASQPNEFVVDPQTQATSSGAVVVHLQQQYKAIPIFQAAQTVRFASNDGALTGTTGTSVTVPEEVQVSPKLSVQEAVLKAAQYVAVPQPDEQEAKDQFGQPLNPTRVDLIGYVPKIIATFLNIAEHPTVLEAGPFGDTIKASSMWFPLRGALRLVWQVIVTMPNHEGQYRVMVDAETGEILYCHQLVQSVLAQGDVYRVDGAYTREMMNFPRRLQDYNLPLPNNLPGEFPYHWVTSDSTAGNSVYCHLGDSGPTIQGNIRQNMLTFDPSEPKGDGQKILNVFYYCCYMHDYLYLLGFKEADGNFQQNNLLPGGIANDPVDARVYSGSVWGTANMQTPSDGTSPVMKMGLVTSTNNHTAFDSSVVFHEYTHGLTHRLIGGAINDHSLDAIQSCSMGEGWSDYMACTINGSTVIGAWLVDRPGGIRGYPYDSNFPDNFGNLGTGRYTEMHNIGEIWCATLMEMNRKIGTTLGLQLVVDALKLSPANPSFLDVRDAILAALDDMLAVNRFTSSEYDQIRRAIWAVFARFGMGLDARSNGPSLEGIVASSKTPWTTTAPQPTWNARYRIGSANDTVPPQSVISATSDKSERLDIFVVGADGGIYSTWREPNTGGWQNWYRIGSANDTVPAQSVISAVSSKPERLDIFVVDADGGIYSTWREPNTGGWQNWYRIGSASDTVPRQSVVTAVSDKSERLDIFVVGADGGIYSTWREPNTGGWQNWYRIGSASDTVLPQSVISAISDKLERLDIFMVGTDGGIYGTWREM